MYLAAQLGGGWTDGGARKEGLKAKGGFFSCTAELGYDYVWSNGFTIRGGIGASASIGISGL